MAQNYLDEDMLANLVNLSGQPTPTDAPYTLPHNIGSFFTPAASQKKMPYSTGGLTEDFYGMDSGIYSADDIAKARAKFPMPQQQNFNFGGGGGGTNPYLRSGRSAYADIYDNLAQSTRDLFGEVEIEDFTEQIRQLAEEGRADIQDISDEQMAFLEQAFDRRTGQITDIGAELAAELGALDLQGQAEIAAVAERGSARQEKMLAEQKDRQATSRAELGDQVSSEFEAVAELTRAMGANTAESSAAAMDRLQAVSRMASQERLAQPAKLVAQAQMALGDEKFRIENQIKQSTSQALRELNAGERQQVLAEAQRLSQMGYQQDMALAQALQGIEAQRAQTYIQEEKERQRRAAAWAAQQKATQDQQAQLERQSAILGVSVGELQAMGPAIVGQMMERHYDPTGEYARADAELAIEAANAETEAFSALETEQNKDIMIASAARMLGEDEGTLRAEYETIGWSGIGKRVAAAEQSFADSQIALNSPEGIAKHFDGEVSVSQIDDYQTWKTKQKEIDDLTAQIDFMENTSDDLTLGFGASGASEIESNQQATQALLDKANEDMAKFMSEQNWTDSSGNFTDAYDANDMISQYVDNLSGSPTGYSTGQYVPITGGEGNTLDQALSALSNYGQIQIVDGKPMFFQSGATSPIYGPMSESNPLFQADSDLVAQILAGMNS